MNREAEKIISDLIKELRDNGLTIWIDNKVAEEVTYPAVHRAIEYIKKIEVANKNNDKIQALEELKECYEKNKDVLKEIFNIGNYKKAHVFLYKSNEVCFVITDNKGNCLKFMSIDEKINELKNENKED